MPDKHRYGIEQAALEAGIIKDAVDSGKAKNYQEASDQVDFEYLNSLADDLMNINPLAPDEAPYRAAGELMHLQQRINKNMKMPPADRKLLCKILTQKFHTKYPDAFSKLARKEASPSPLPTPSKKPDKHTTESRYQETTWPESGDLTELLQSMSADPALAAAGITADKLASKLKSTLSSVLRRKNYDIPKATYYGLKETAAAHLKPDALRLFSLYVVVGVLNDAGKHTDSKKVHLALDILKYKGGKDPHNLKEVTDCFWKQI